MVDNASSPVNVKTGPRPALSYSDRSGAAGSTGGPADRRRREQLVGVTEVVRVGMADDQLTLAHEPENRARTLPSDSCIFLTPFGDSRVVDRELVRPVGPRGAGKRAEHRPDVYHPHERRTGRQRLGVATAAMAIARTASVSSAKR